MQAGDVDTAEQMIRQAAATAPTRARIEYTIALVERAKASRPQKARPRRLPGADRIPSRPRQRPAVVASVAPAPQPQETYTPEPAARRADHEYEAPAIESSSLPPPEATGRGLGGCDARRLRRQHRKSIRRPRCASLQSNPTVVMQAVPKDDLAGPVQQRAEPKPQAAPAAPKPVARDAARAQAALRFGESAADDEAPAEPQPRRRPGCPHLLCAGRRLRHRGPRRQACVSRWT